MNNLPGMFIDLAIPKEKRDFYTSNQPYPPSVIDNDLSMMYVNHPEMGSNTEGGVDSRMPRSLLLNRSFASKPMKQLIPHELEHMLQYKVDKRYQGTTNYDQEVVNEYAKRKKISYQEARTKIMNLLQNAAKNKELKTHLQKQGYTPSGYFGVTIPNWADLVEQFADLSAMEYQGKKPISNDPVVRKHFFGDDQDFIDVYKGTTGLRTDRFDAKDLPPMQAEPKLQPPPVKPKEPSMLEALFKMLRR